MSPWLSGVLLPESEEDTGTGMRLESEAIVPGHVPGRIPGCAEAGLSHTPALPAVTNVFASVSAEASTPFGFGGIHLGRPAGNETLPRAPWLRQRPLLRCSGAPGAGKEVPLKAVKYAVV